MRYEGIISVWIHGKNFGFITPSAEGDFQRLFLHRSKITSGLPVVGANVQYDVNPVREGMNPSAINVVIIDGGAL